MPTINQLVKAGKRKSKIHTNNVKRLLGCPQRIGRVIKVRIAKPKKPNSAQRKIAKVRLTTKKAVLAYIPGSGHTLKPYSEVMVIGGRANDLPGVRFSLMRGKKDFSWKETHERKTARSKYGAPKEKNQ